jgi:hypothetical protein
MLQFGCKHNVFDPKKQELFMAVQVDNQLTVTCDKKRLQTPFSEWRSISMNDSPKPGLRGGTG